MRTLPLADRGPGRRPENQESGNQDHKDAKLDVGGFDLFAEIFGGPADHQSGQEHGQYDKDEHPVQTRAHSPKTISPSWMLIRGIIPPRGEYESCMELTAPQEASVVTVANRAESKIPKRTSLPSMLPVPVIPSPCIRGLARDSAFQQTRKPARNRRTIVIQTAQPCFLFLTSSPDSMSARWGSGKMANI